MKLLKEVEPEIYQGVDVKRVKSGGKTLFRYLTKYITKNDPWFYRFPWHCSPDISRLFTSVNFIGKEEDRFY